MSIVESRPHASSALAEAPWPRAGCRIAAPGEDRPDEHDLGARDKEGDRPEEPVVQGREGRYPEQTPARRDRGRRQQHRDGQACDRGHGPPQRARNYAPDHRAVGKHGWPKDSERTNHLSKYICAASW